VSTVDDYLGRVQAIVWTASGYVSAEGISRVQHLVDHGEPAEGMCSLAWIIVNEQRKVPRSLIRAIREHSSALVDEKFMPGNLNEFGVDDGS